MEINGYLLETELQNANSGFSKWAFATRGGRKYFIKELITPVYPTDRSVMSDEMFESKCRFCHEYEQKFEKFYSKINRDSRGTLVRINEFFRIGGRYYVVTDKVEGEKITTEDIAALPESKKILLLKTVAHAFNYLHNAGMIHFDVKPANIMIKTTRSGNYAAKVIDFDSGVMIGDELDAEELGGDLTYLAPETFRAMLGEDVKPDEKSDIFALGVVFHEYYCGKLPYYNTSEYEYIYEAKLDGGEVRLDPMPEKIKQLISDMLETDPEKRLSAQQVVDRLNEIDVTYPVEADYITKESEHATVPEKLEPVKESPARKSDGWFNTAGDL